jgi:hypothetical protein
MLLSAVYDDDYKKEKEEGEEVEKDNGTSALNNLIERRTNQLTPWSSVLEKLPVTQLLKNFLTFYAT